MEEEVTLDLREFFFIIKKHSKLIISITLLSTMISGFLSFFVIPPTYQSKVTLVIGKGKDTGLKDENYNYNDVMMYQKLVKTYAEIAKLDVVAKSTIEKANLGISVKAFKDMIKVTPQADTQILEVLVSNKDPKKAKEIADVFTEEFIKKGQDVPSGDIQILDKAQVPEKPVKPKKKLNVAIASLIGLMVSIGIVFLMEYMDNTIKTEEDVNKFLDMPVMGTIPEHN